MLDILEGRTYIIGREGHIYVKDPAASKQHAELSFSDGKVRIRDLGSTNGIYILKDGQPVKLLDEYVEPHQTIAIGKEKHTVENLIQIVWSFTHLIPGYLVGTATSGFCNSGLKTPAPAACIRNSSSN